MREIESNCCNIDIFNTASYATTYQYIFSIEGFMKKLFFLLFLFSLTGCEYTNFIYISHNDVTDRFSLNYKESRNVDGQSRIKYYTPDMISEWVNIIKAGMDNTLEEDCESIKFTISFVQNSSPTAMNYLAPQYRGFSHLTYEEMCEKIMTIPLGGQFMIQTARRNRPSNIVDRDDYYLEYAMEIDGVEVDRSSEIGFLYSVDPDINGFFYFGANMRIEESLKPGSEIIIQVIDKKNNSVDTFEMTYLGV